MKLTPNEVALSKATDHGYKAFYNHDAVPPVEYSVGKLRQAWDNGWKVARQAQEIEQKFY